MRRAVVLTAVLAAAAAATAADAVSGERKVWHKVTLTFTGPATSEKADPNPFLDYRLTATFTHDGVSREVCGYYAADGNAGETSADAGGTWRVHFVPDSPGEWAWKVSFRMGKDVAISDDADAGKPAAFDGQSGTFQVAPTDKAAPDPRARGVLRYAGKRYLRFAGTGEYYLKGGADSPENFLGYADFDQTPPRHRYQPHVADWKAGDPTWKGGKGKGIIGALNYLAGKGMNSVYFLTMNVRGDGKDVWPWTAPAERRRFDCSKLDQWEIVFAHMDRVGIGMHVITQETENDQGLNGGALGLERKLYYRELVARFAHHLAVTWNLGEENTNTDEQRKQFATSVRATRTTTRSSCTRTPANTTRSTARCWALPTSRAPASRWATCGARTPRRSSGSPARPRRAGGGSSASTRSARPTWASSPTRTTPTTTTFAVTRCGAT